LIARPTLEAALTVTITVACWAGAPDAVAFTTSGYVAGASVVDAMMVSVELSGTLVLAMLAVSPAGAPVIVYVTALVRPPLGTALIDVVVAPPGASETVVAPSVRTNA
jgi:hypothetical protein